MSKTRSVKMTNYPPSGCLRRRPQRPFTSMRLGFIAIASTTLLVLLLNCMDAKYVESCEKSYAAANPTEVALRCQLRTLNTDFDHLNFSVITSSPSDSITSLSLSCSHVLFYQSTLVASSFRQFSNLQSLSVDHCKLSQLESGVFDGLRLKNLTINTYNTAWPALSLDLSPGVLNEVSTLERIDLSHNNIWTLPDRVFCPLGALRYLNVSLNRLQDLGDLGFRDDDAKESSDGCQTNLEVLDISHNRLILLPSNGLARLEQLQELYLQGNEISAIASQSLRRLNHLSVLNLAHNKIASLPEDMFNDSEQLSEIYLQNNSMRTLPAELLSTLSHLQVLDLSHNSFTLLEPFESEAAEARNIHDFGEQRQMESSFSSLARLVLLDMGHNQISRISANTFHGLSSLQVLNLEHNEIQAIEPNSFSTLGNLHTLILSNNLLTFVASGCLNGLPALGQLSLDNNNITDIDGHALRNCSSLKDLNLNGNALTAEVGNAIQKLTHLRTVDLGENQLESVPHLLGLPNLYGLRLTGNRIENVSKDAFIELPSLKILNIARNQLKLIDENTFDSNLNLQALRLDSNYLTDISNLFTQLPNLIWLNISDNQLSWFDYALVPKQLQWLDLHKNVIRDLRNYYQVQDLKLTTLDASHNQISSLSAVNLPDSLEVVYLNDNLIRTIAPHTFLKKVNISRVDIFANQIETLELTSLRLGRIPLDRQLPEMYLTGNPIICDCNAEWLQRINKLEHIRQYFKVADLGTVYCKVLNEDIVIPIADVHSSQFLCPYTKHCFSLCECCDSNSCDCQQQCPHNCHCFNDDIWATNMVDCSNRGHTMMPSNIPTDVSQLYLDGNTIDELPSYMLAGLKNLQTLHLNNSGITRIANNSLSGLVRLTSLYLQNNFIQRLEGFEFKDLTELRELYLHNNQIIFISNSTFVDLTQLEVLRLDHNRLMHFEMWVLSKNANLAAINLAYNEWSCECAFLAQAMPWARSNIARLDNPGSLTCSLYGRSFSLLYMNGTRCLDSAPVAVGGSVPKNVESSAADYEFVPIFLTCLTGVVFLIGIAIFLARRCTRKSQSPCIWVKEQCRTCLSHQARTRDNSSFDETDGKLFDAYFCYSWKDDSWVQVLEHALISQNPPYRLCLHHNLPKTAYVSDLVIEGAESSQRTLLILSPNFLQDEWCRPEFKSALCSAACALHRNGKTLLIVILGELSMGGLDPELRTLLRASLVLPADDKNFLTKLIAALPAPRQPYSSSRSFPQSPPHWQSPKDQNLKLSFNRSDYQRQDQFQHYINHVAGESTLDSSLVPILQPYATCQPSGVPRRPPPPLPPVPVEEFW